jgi:hypothetical protein
MMFSVAKRARHPGFPKNSFDISLIISETVNDSYVLKAEGILILKTAETLREN